MILVDGIKNILGPQIGRAALDRAKLERALAAAQLKNAQLEAEVVDQQLLINELADQLGQWRQEAKAENGI